MTNIAQEDVTAYKNVREKLFSIAEQYLVHYNKKRGDVLDCYIDGDWITIRWEEGCCGSWEQSTDSLPLEYLFDPNWVGTEYLRRQKAKEERIAAEEAAKELKRQELEKKKLEAQAKEYQDFLRLKKKYEGSVT